MSEPLTIKVKYAHKDQPRLVRHGDWIDLSLAATVNLKARQSTIAPLGIVVALPEGYEANIVPRSSTFKKYGVIQTNHYGVIDHDYCGPNDWWGMPLYATRDIMIEKGTRIAQFRLNRVMGPVDIVEIDKLSGPDRGGFGSTGEK